MADALKMFDNRIEITGLDYNDPPHKLSPDIRSLLPEPYNTEATALVLLLVTEKADTVDLVYRLFGGNVDGGRESDVSTKSFGFLTKDLAEFRQFVVPLDGAGKFNYYLGTSDLKLYIIGCFTDPFVWVSDYTELAGGADGSYGDVDLGGSGNNVLNGGADDGNAVLAIVSMVSANINNSGNVRPKGSAHTTTFAAKRSASHHFVAVDPNDLFELMWDSKGDPTMQIIGYITADNGIVMRHPGDPGDPLDIADISFTKDNTYQDVDLTSLTAADAIVPILQFQTFNLECNFAARHPDSTNGDPTPTDYVTQRADVGLLLSGMNADQEIELLSETVNGFIEILGYVVAAEEEPAPAPAVVSVCPVDGATLDTGALVVTITFSEEMDESTLSAAITITQDDTTVVDGAVSYDNPSRTATFTPTVDFLDDFVFEVKVATTAKSAAGAFLEEEFISHFRVRNAVNHADREPIQIVEIEQPLCALTYSESPCTAELDVTGTRKCYNTAQTCQDRANYDPSDLITWRLSRAMVDLPNRLFEAGSGRTVKTNPIPSLRSVSTSPTEINIAAGSSDSAPMGRRASVTVQLTDAPYSDQFADPYLADRSFDPLDQGTFWSKWLARNPFYSNYVLRVLDGYIGQPTAKMIAREYFIETISGPDSKGKVTIKAKDILRLADDKRTQFPPVTEIELEADIDDNQTTFVDVLGTTSDLTDAMGNAATFHIRIDNEIIEYTGITSIGDNRWVLDGVVRGALNTTAELHDAEQAMQRVGYYTNEESWTAVRELITTWTSIDSSFITTADWDAEGNQYLTNYNITGVVEEPTPVIDLIGEIAQQFSFYLWWDERAKLIRLKAIHPELNADIMEVNECDDIVQNSVSLKEIAKERLSRVFVYYVRRDPTKKLDDIGNYGKVIVQIDADAESDDEYGESRTKKIFSRWLISDPIASQIAFTTLNKYRDNPRYVTMSLDARRGVDIWTGDIVDVTHRSFVDDTGEKIVWRGQVISAEEKAQGQPVKYKLQHFEFEGNFMVWEESGTPVFTSASAEEKAFGGWWSDTDGKMSDDTDGYKWQ